MNRTGYALSLLALVLAFGACNEFGHSTQFANPNTFVENLGANRYEYEIATVTSVTGGRGTTARDGERARIFVRIQYSGWGTSGARRSLAEFDPTLRTLTRRIGGADYRVLSVTRDRWQLITDLVVAVSDGGASTPSDTLPPITVSPMHRTAH